MVDEASIVAAAILRGRRALDRGAPESPAVSAPALLAACEVNALGTFCHTKGFH